jgi:hypothetical protein
MAKYYTKFPRVAFKDRAQEVSRSGFYRTEDAARRMIERAYAAGHTGEPYVQLVEETATEYRIVAEWMPGKGWTDALTAAGFLPRRV